MVCERWVERRILRERTSSSHIFFQEPRGCQRLHPLASSSEMPLIGCVSLAWLRFSALCLNLTAWFSSHDPPSGYTPVRLECPDAPSSSCLLIKMWQLTRAHRVTRNEPKIHGICYITHARPSPLLISTLGRPSGHWPCVKFYLVGSRDK